MAGFVVLMVLLVLAAAPFLGVVVIPADRAIRICTWSTGLTFGCGGLIVVLDFMLPQVETANGPVGFTCPDTNSSLPGDVVFGLMFASLALLGVTLAAGSSAFFRAQARALSFVLTALAFGGLLFAFAAAALPALCDPT